MTTRHWTFNDLLAALKHNVGQSTMPEIAGITQIRKHVAKITITATESATVHGPNYYAYPAWFTKGLHNWWTLASFETQTGTDGVRDSRTGNWQDFDGVDDEVKVADQTAIQNGFDGGATVEAWVYPRTDGQGSIGIIISKGTGGGDIWRLSAKVGTGNFINLTWSYTFSGTDGFWETDASNLPLNTWSLVGLAYNNSAVGNTPSFYINGVLEASSTTTAPTGTRTTDVGAALLIGDDELSVAAWDGFIAEVRFWDDIRTATELLDNKDLALGGDEAGFAGYWKFNEGSGSIARDSTANGNDGTITGATWGATTYHGTINGNPTTPATTDDLTKGRKRHHITMDGTGDFVNIGDITILDSATKMTWGARIKVDSATRSNTIVARWPSANGDKQFIFNVTATGGLQAFFATDAAGGFAQGNQIGVISADTWYDVMLVLDGSGAANADRLKLYLDGVVLTLTFTNTIPASLQTVADDVLIGSTEDASIDALDGDIQDVVFWSDVALTAAQALAWTTDSIADRILASFFKAPGDFTNEVLPILISYTQPNPRRRPYRNGYKHQITNQV